jgi:hypothetical protein
VLDRCWICDHIAHGVAGESDEACSGADDIESDTEKLLVNGSATRVSGGVAGSARPGGNSENCLGDVNYPKRLIDTGSSGQSARRIGSWATVVATVGETRLIDKDSVQNLRIIIYRLIETVDTRVKPGNDNIGHETPTSTRRRQTRIVRDQRVKNTITVNVTRPIATGIDIGNIPILSRYWSRKSRISRHMRT